MLVTCPICEWDSVIIKDASIEKAPNGKYTVTITYECLNEHRWKVTTRTSTLFKTEQITSKV